MAKVVIDAGHGGKDPGAVYHGRKEKEDALRLALAVGKILEQHGIEVSYTRTDDIYHSPIQKAEMANKEKADYFISFHRNSSTESNKHSGVETLVFQKKGAQFPLAERINYELEKIGFRNLGVKERPDLAVLKHTKMPAVLIETGFLNHEQDNRLFDQSFQEIAQGIANAILSMINHEGGSQNPSEPEERVYYVQTGAFRNRSYALQMKNKLEKEGYSVTLREKRGYHLVQVGTFRTRTEAEKIQEKLRKAGYQTCITR